MLSVLSRSYVRKKPAGECNGCCCRLNRRQCSKAVSIGGDDGGWSQPTHTHSLFTRIMSGLSTARAQQLRQFSRTMVGFCVFCALVVEDWLAGWLARISRISLFPNSFFAELLFLALRNGVAFSAVLVVVVVSWRVSVSNCARTVVNGRRCCRRCISFAAAHQSAKRLHKRTQTNQRECVCVLLNEEESGERVLRKRT